jgi:hypothetical protein
MVRYRHNAYRAPAPAGKKTAHKARKRKSHAYDNKLKFS